jgi:predicted ABC-type ATPase
MTKQHLIIIDGPNGAGKTTTSVLLHENLENTVLLSFDKVKNFISNFQPSEKNILMTNQIMLSMTKQYLEGGFDVIVEAIFPEEKFVLPYLKIAKSKKVSAVVYQIEAPFEVRAKRIKERPLAKGAKRKMTKQWIGQNDLRYFENKYAGAEVITSHDKTTKEIVKIILKDLER